MLAYIVLVVFGLLAVLTLVVDVGFVTLTRVTMQDAADAAATEAVRQRDAVEGDGYASDCVRRLAARDMVRWTFDDDFDAATAETARQFGAGPQYGYLDEGVGGLDALRTFTLSEDQPPVYKPQLQLNRDNAAHGDIVAGTFTGHDPFPLPDEAADYTQPGHDDPEPARRTRQDFLPSESVPVEGASPLVPCPAEAPDPTAWTPASGAGSLSDTAMLVRLRRTANPDGLDDLPDLDDAAGSNGTSSTGGPIPLLFGRGALITDADPDAPVGIRRDGLTVRASAVAAAAPAVAAGVARPELPEGVTSIVIERALVEALAADAGTFAASADVDGHVTSGGSVVADLSLDVSSLATFLAARRGEPQEGSLLFVGDDLEACAVGCEATALTPLAGAVVWMPVRDIVSGVSRIVGFVRARVIVTPDPGPGAGLAGTLLIDRVAPSDPFILRSAVAARHASARVWREGPAFDAATAQAMRTVTGCLSGTADPACPTPVDVLLRAPRLAR